MKMKLLLTSGGITNKSIAKALFDLVGKKPEDTTLCFVPTAATVEMGDKDWFINDLKNIDKIGEVAGLNYVNFYTLPHLNSPYFPDLVEKNIANLAKIIPKKIYALDDQSALKIIDGKVEIISKGKYLIFNE